MCPKSFKEYTKHLSDYECRHYLYELLKAVKACHERGIMHRDIKTRNIVINPDTKELRLLDFGLSEYYIPGKEYKVRVSSRPYKPPELLIGFGYYDYSMDLWCVGCTFGSMVDSNFFLIFFRFLKDGICL